MAMLGFGKVKFENEETSVTFDVGRGRIKYVPVYDGAGLRDLNDRSVQFLKGFTQVVSVDLFTVSTDTVEKMKTLFIMLNRTIDRNDSRYITIYPRFGDTGADVNYDCQINSDVELQDIANVDVGQTISLEFIGMDVLPLSTVTSDSTLDYLVDESGNNIVDESGNNFVMK